MVAYRATPSHDIHKLFTQGMQGVQGSERDYVRQHDSKGPLSLGPASALPQPSRHASPARSVSSVMNIYFCLCPSIYVCIYLSIYLSVCHILVHLHVYIIGDEHDIPSNCLGSLPGSPCVRASWSGGPCIEGGTEAGYVSGACCACARMQRHTTYRRGTNVRCRQTRMHLLLMLHSHACVRGLSLPDSASHLCAHVLEGASVYERLFVSASWQGRCVGRG